MGGSICKWLIIPKKNPGIKIINQSLYKNKWNLLSISSKFKLIFGLLFFVLFLIKKSIKKPVKDPTIIQVTKIKRALIGSFAKIKNAASPIVEVKTATKQPKVIFPCKYCVTTIIAPPQPGIAPKKDAIGIWSFRLFLKKLLREYFFDFSNLKKINKVIAT